MNFITHSGVAINLDRVSFIDFRKEGAATVHSGGASFAFDGDDAASLLKRFPPAPAQSALVAKNGKSKSDPTGTGPVVPEPVAKADA
jgi:hypothetical protein